MRRVATMGSELELTIAPRLHHEPNLQFAICNFQSAILLSRR